METLSSKSAHNVKLGARNRPGLNGQAQYPPIGGGCEPNLDMLWLHSHNTTTLFRTLYWSKQRPIGRK